MTFEIFSFIQENFKNKIKLNPIQSINSGLIWLLKPVLHQASLEPLSRILRCWLL